MFCCRVIDPRKPNLWIYFQLYWTYWVRLTIFLCPVQAVVKVLMIPSLFKIADTKCLADSLSPKSIVYTRWRSDVMTDFVHYSQCSFHIFKLSLHIFRFHSIYSDFHSIYWDFHSIYSDFNSIYTYIYIWAVNWLQFLCVA